MTEVEARKANFIDGEMQDKYYANGEKFTPEDVSLAYDRGKSDAELDAREYCEKLEHMIARMKCCENCRHKLKNIWCGDKTCHNLSHWELRDQ